MPDQYKLVKGQDGRDYVELPGGIQFPADDLKERQPTFGSKIAEGAYKVLTPEVLGTAAAFLGPETGGASLVIPPLVGGATSIGRDLLAGERDPKTIASDALMHSGLNLVPGLIGRGARLAMGGRMGAALASMSEGGGWTGNIAKGLRAFLGPEASPAVQAAAAGGATRAPVGVQIALLQQKLANPMLNPTAKAAALQAIRRLELGQQQTVVKGLHSALGAGSVGYEALK